MVANCFSQRYECLVKSTPLHYNYWLSLPQVILHPVYDDRAKTIGKMQSKLNLLWFIFEHFLLNLSCKL